MKIRNGFVSNSSSSSFIVYDKENQQNVIELLKQSGYYDYYIYKDVLYTSFISDGSDMYSDIDRLADDEIDGNHGEPYCEDDFVCLKGRLHGENVWISKYRLTKDDYEELGVKDQALTKLVEEFISHYEYDNWKEYQECLSPRIVEFIFKARKILNGEDDE